MELISFAPMRINKVNKLRFEDITYDYSFPEVRDVKDAVVADFNNDEKMDMYLTNSKEPSDIVFVNNKISANLVDDNLSIQPEIKFRSSGSVKIWVGPPTMQSAQIYIGGKKNVTGKHQFELDSNDAVIKEGHMTYDDAKVLIEFNSEDQTWLITSLTKLLTIEVLTQGKLELVSKKGVESNIGAVSDKLLIQKNRKLVEESILKNTNIKNSCNSVVAEDFDNDMDVDIYLVCSRTTGNLSNIYLDNQGNGTFNIVDSAGGAQGYLLGRGDSVTTADYDHDGFMDLFITNGAGITPFAHQGRNQLFRNQGNKNNWLQIDLKGVMSNYDGIGAKIILEAGNKKQIREQSGGMHRNSQNYKRIHFGLADNDIVNNLTIIWPSGVVQNLNNVEVNKIITITESEN